MILVEDTLGNLRDPVWQDRARRAAVDPLVLEQWEAPKSRLRKASSGGVELAISLPRSKHLQDGDVLHYDEAAKVIVAARIALKEVLVIELEGLEALSPLQRLADLLDEVAREAGLGADAGQFLRCAGVQGRGQGGALDHGVAVAQVHAAPANEGLAAAAHGLSQEGWIAKILGAVAVMLASVNIFGGFLVTQRMLAMYKKKGQ